MLGYDLTDFTCVDSMRYDFEKFVQLWNFAERWERDQHTWNSNPFKSIKGKKVCSQLAFFYQLLNELELKFLGISEMLKVIAIYRQQLNTFKSYIPIILKLRNHAIEKYHRALIFRRLHVDLLE